jgi:hypothetical protein
VTADKDSTAVFVIDDNATLRRAILERLSGCIDAKATPVRFVETRFIWDLFGKLEPHRDDIVISDLYTAGYWLRVPPGSHYTPVNPLEDDSGNIVLGSVDAKERFLRPLRRMGVQVFLVTFVPGWLRMRGRAELADSLEADLASEQLARVHLKIDQSADPRNFEAVCQDVAQLLKERRSKR